MVQLAYYQHKLKQGYDANVKLRPLVPGDLVLRKVLGTVKNPAWGKLGPNWEGPYCITSMVGIGAYFLEELDEHVILRPWNVNNLKNVLLLMKVSFVNMFIYCAKALYFPLFVLYKYLNRTLVKLESLDHMFYGN